MKNIISLSNVDFSYSGKSVFQHFSMHVPENSIFGFLGANGSGKTTAIRLMLGLLAPDSGAATIFGKSISDNRKAILHQVGAMVEVPSLYLHLSGYDNMEITRRLLGDIPNTRTLEVLEIVGMKNDAHRVVRTYSLGMKQRVGIALSLLSRPRLLILDEPTNGLDPSGIKEIRELIHTLHRNSGTTVLISSHLLTEVEKMATHVGILQGGRCVFQGPIETLQSLASKKIFKVKVDHVGKALESIRSFAEATVVRTDALQNIVFLEVSESLSIPEINKLMVQYGVSVFSMEPEIATLETSFIELTETKDGKKPH